MESSTIKSYERNKNINNHLNILSQKQFKIMTQLNKDISPDAYNEFLSDVATAVQQHRVQAIQSVQTRIEKLGFHCAKEILGKRRRGGVDENN